MPKDGDCVMFDEWQNTQRHTFAIYADFETLLEKTDKVKGGNTKIVHKHEVMSYGLIVKESEDVPTELLSEHNIPTAPVIYRGSESQSDVAIVCDNCKRSFLTILYLFQHILRCTGVKPYGSDIRDKVVSQAEDLKKYKKPHTRLKSHKCDTFDKIFSQ